MGKEAVCTVRWRGEVSDGKASLEMPFLRFQGSFRLKIDVSKANVGVKSGVLTVPEALGTAEFHLGDQAAKWADAILHPKNRLDKMGLKSGMRLRLVGKVPADFAGELKRAGIDTVRGPGDHSVLFAETRADLGKVTAIEPPVWIVYPKGVERITQDDVLRAGRAVGLKDVKVCSFSPTQTGLRFTLPVKESRAKSRLAKS